MPGRCAAYDASEIEPKWQRVWEDEGLYRASDDPDDPRPRFYALDMFPYPSGDLHMGHAEAFSGGDAVARFQAMRGLQRAAPDRLGRVRAARRERGDQARRPPRRRGPTRTSSSRRRRSSGWACRSTGRRAAGHLRSRVLPLDPVAVPAVLRAGAGLPEELAGQLVPEGPDRARERAGDPGRLRAVRHDGRAPRPDAVVLQDHGLRAAAAGRHGDARSTGPSGS